MKRAMWVASALLTLGFVGCDRSSSPATSNSTPSSTSSTSSTSSDTDEATTPPTGTDAMGGIGQAAPDDQTGQSTAQACPITVEADSIASVDVPNGAALVFETDDPTEKSELRQELTTIASTQTSIASDRTGTNETGSGVNVGNSVSRGQDTEGGTEGRTGFEGPTNEERPGGWVESASEARAEETAQGVQLVFTTDSDVEGLREEVRERADELNQRCAMTSSP